MKQLFQKIFDGFLLGIGAISAFLIWELSRDTYQDLTRQEMPHLNTEKIVVESARLSDVGETISIIAKIRNDSGIPIPVHAVKIWVSFSTENGLFGRCSRYSGEFKIDETKEIIIACSHFKRSSFPENAKYELSITDDLEY